MDSCNSINNWGYLAEFRYEKKQVMAEISSIFYQNLSDEVNSVMYCIDSFREYAQS